MEKRKVIVAAAVAGLVAAGSMMAKATVSFADDAAKAEHKDGCESGNGCMGKKEETHGHDKVEKKAKKAKHAEKHEEKHEEHHEKKAE